jgi:hypothetical protein
MNRQTINGVTMFTSEKLTRSAQFNLFFFAEFLIAQTDTLASPPFQVLNFRVISRQSTLYGVLPLGSNDEKSSYLFKDRFL